MAQVPLRIAEQPNCRPFQERSVLSWTASKTYMTREPPCFGMCEELALTFTIQSQVWGPSPCRVYPKQELSSLFGSCTTVKILRLLFELHATPSYITDRMRRLFRLVSHSSTARPTSLPVPIVPCNSTSTNMVVMNRSLQTTITKISCGVTQHLSLYCEPVAPLS